MTDLPTVPATGLAVTPGQTIGPFFHYALPFAGGSELVAPGSPGSIRLYGVVYDGAGAPVPDALLEIRQTDAEGRLVAREGSFARKAAFTGWGRAATDRIGRYSFTTVEPGPARDGGPAFFSVVVFARGLLDRLFTRAYVPGDGVDSDPLLSRLGPRAATLVAERDENGDLRFDVHLQGERETVFLTFPGHDA